MKHTPGPWTHAGRRTQGGRRVQVILSADDATIATTGGWDPHYETEETANARLIAAAPEAFAALRLFLDQYGNGMDSHDPEREARPEIQAARAAFKKAGLI
jgi:hypothetical protein